MLFACRGRHERFRWRCAWGSYPYPSRTRWSSRRRPMVLRPERGRAGGRRSTFQRHEHYRRDRTQEPAGGVPERRRGAWQEGSGPSPPEPIGGRSRQLYLENRILTMKRTKRWGRPHRTSSKENCRREAGGGMPMGAACGTSIRRARLKAWDDPRKRHARRGGGRHHMMQSVKRRRAQGGCLGARSRRKARQAAKSRGEGHIPVDPRMPEWGDPAGHTPATPCRTHRHGGGNPAN